MSIGDGNVLQSTRHNVPGVQITPFDSPFLKPLFRYARRLKISSKETNVLVFFADDFGANEAGRQRVIETTRKMSRAVWKAMVAP